MQKNPPDFRRKGAKCESFKRKISDSLETVSDPIDVAVITKHEGFIWVKNKQGV